MALLIDVQPSKKLLPFIERLWGVLLNPATFGAILAWTNGGRSFTVFDPERLIAEVFSAIKIKATKLTSFQKQLNLHGFSSTRNEFSHPDFVQGDRARAAAIERIGSVKKALIWRPYSRREGPSMEVTKEPVPFEEFFALSDWRLHHTATMFTDPDLEFDWSENLCEGV
jgi:hypothetical protein